MGLGVLKLTPKEFREYSLGEFCLAVDGYMMANGQAKKPASWNDVLDELDKFNGK
jgi:hypothetical protein